MKKILKWGGIALLVLIVIGFISSMGGDSSQSDSSNKDSGGDQVQQAQTVYQVGEPITSKKMELMVNGVEERSSVGGQYLKENASEGGTLIVINWQYKNTSSEPIGTFSQPSIKLLDSNGVEYSSDLGKTSIYATENKLDSKVLSDLNPGITVKDAKVFELGKEAFQAGGWTLVVQAEGESFRVPLN